jgi:predicted transcriptional regulator
VSRNDKPKRPKKRKVMLNRAAQRMQNEAAYREKQSKALELLAEGYTYSEIGEQIGVTQQMVSVYVKDGLSLYKERIAESVETLVAMEWRRLEHQETKLWRLVRSAENDAFDKDGNRDYKSIATLYARLQSLNADRLKLIEKIDPGADLSLDTRVSLVVVRSRQELPKIIEATEFAQRVLHDGLSAEGAQESETDG